MNKKYLERANEKIDAMIDRINLKAELGVTKINTEEIIADLKLLKEKIFEKTEKEKEREIVLDCFCGSGSVCMASKQMKNGK